MKLPTQELKKRVESFQKVLQQQRIEAALLIQTADVLYYSGTAQNVHVFIPCAGEPLVMAYRDYVRAKMESPWTVVQLSGLSKLPDYILQAGFSLPTVLGMEFDVLPVSQYERYRKAFPDVTIVDVSSIIRLQRTVKSPWELERLTDCAQVAAKVFKQGAEILHPGITEVEFEAELERFALIAGHEGYVRVRGFGTEFHVGGVFAGTRGAVPGRFDGPVVGQGVSVSYPQGATRSKIQAGEPVLVDLVIVVNGYQIDQTRMFAIDYLPSELWEAYQKSVQLEEKIRQTILPGRVTGQIYDEVIDWVQQNTAYADNFMGCGSSRVSFVGHGVGLELDELPTISYGSKSVLEPNMVLAVEPKFVFPALGAVGIEDMFVVEGGEGARCLSLGDKEVILV